MYLRTIQNAKELEEAQKREIAEAKIAIDSGKVFMATETSKAYVKSVAYFEAYLNTLYSLLQVVHRITLLIYQKKSKTPIATEKMGRHFGDLVTYLRDTPTFDSDFSTYINQKMEWYITFKNNRHKITHDGSALLLFTQNNEIEFLDYPKNGTGFGDPSTNKQGLQNYVKNRLGDLFDFLEFYSKHFSKWTG
jgi:hypothetical protein